MNIIVETIMEKEKIIQKLDNKKEKLISFLELCNTLPEEITKPIFETFHEKLPLFIEDLLKYSKDFWKFFSNIMIGIKSDINSISFKRLFNLIN
jgi:hypothetical protein